MTYKQTILTYQSTFVCKAHVSSIWEIKRALYGITTVSIMAPCQWPIWPSCRTQLAVRWGLSRPHTCQVFVKSEPKSFKLKCIGSRARLQLKQ